MRLVSHAVFQETINEVTFTGTMLIYWRDESIELFKSLNQLPG